MTCDGYPTEEELEKIRNWSIVYREDIHEIFEYISTIWWSTRDLFIKQDKTYILHTGGWSGNEEIINAMIQNTFLWMFSWYSSKRGGHYEFRIMNIRGMESEGEE